jgi:Rieske Fe-S protein
MRQMAKPRHRFPFLHKKSQSEKRQSVSRRALLAGGAAAAASLVMGAGIGAGVERAIEPKQPVANAPQWDTDLVPTNIPTTWHFVTTVAALGTNAIPFSSNGIVGYVIRDDDDDGDSTSDASSNNNTNSPDSATLVPDQIKLVAISAACTHMGCIVQWQSSDRKYHCPCHGGLFSEYGKADNTAGHLNYLADLPRLRTKIDSNGNIFVQVPLHGGSPTKSIEEEMPWQVM